MEIEIPSFVKHIAENGVTTVVDASIEEIVALIALTNPTVLDQARKDIILAKQAALLDEKLEAEASSDDTEEEADEEEADKED